MVSPTLKVNRDSLVFISIRGQSVRDPVWAAGFVVVDPGGQCLRREGPERGPEDRE